MLYRSYFNSHFTDSIIIILIFQLRNLKFRMFK